MIYHISDLIEHNSWIFAINGSDWGAGALEVLHYFSMFMIVGPMAIIDLRIIGITRKGQTPSELSKALFPLIWMGVLLNSFTGIIMAAGTATMYYNNDVMGYKLLLIILGILAAVIIQQNVGKWERMPSIPVGAKFVALVSILLWFGAILAGVEIPALTGVG